MPLSTHVTNNHLVFDIPASDGPLVVYDDIALFIEEIVAAWSEGHYASITFNMTSKNYLNSSGLSDLIQVKDALLDRDIPFNLYGLHQKVESLLTMVGMLEFFTVYPAESDIR